LRWGTVKYGGALGKKKIFATAISSLNGIKIVSNVFKYAL